ncbi:hypothetical protein [Pseudomonas sp. MWU318]|uniref:hypothetical protein n=1 Tax=Pseudomonas sp. MWU318 TaxID=2802569 RepID=UPI001926F111|nr:hypothetical protein [Pseudomonas sp. MWU318]
MEMATTGYFEFSSDKWGTTQANKLELTEDGPAYRVLAKREVGKSMEWFYLDFPKREGKHTFVFSELLAVKYLFRSDDYTFRFTGKSGSLTATSVGGAVAVTGTFNFEMTADPDSDSQGPKTLSITNGKFDLKN